MTSGKNTILITVASWEDRFRSGCERVLSKGECNKVLMYFFSEYAQRSKQNRDCVKAMCQQRGIPCDEYDLSFDTPAKSWHRLVDTLSPWRTTSKKFTIDITTMPRETIWTTFWVLDDASVRIEYVYHKPESYGDWLSRDPDKPRLVYKLSGEARLGAATALVVLTGYDIDRVQQLIRFFEPDRTFLGLQVGDQFQSAVRNADKHREQYRDERGVEFFEIDAYGPDHGHRVIEQRVKELSAERDIVLASLGPKLSAVALYKVKKKWSHTALAYAPSRDFNRDYSHGISESIWGTL